MSWPMLAALSALVAFAAFVQGSSGLGFALITAPVLELVVPALLPVTVLLLMLPLNAFVASRERAALDWHGSAWITAGRFAGTFIGLAVLVRLSASALDVLIGVSTIAAALATVLMPAFQPTRSAFVAAGLVTGITETATGIGGPPLALVYQHQPVAVMRSTIALCLLVGQLISLVFLWHAGRLGAVQWAGAALLLPALCLGTLLSRLAHRRVSARGLRIFVIGFSIVSGVVLLARA